MPGLVAVLIIRAAYHLTVESARDLMDVSLPEEEEAWIREHVAEYRPTVRGFHELRTRKAGSYRFIEFHLLVDATMSVEDSHDITDVISADIERQFPYSNVTIHIEPCNEGCTQCGSFCTFYKNKTGIEGAGD